MGSDDRETVPVGVSLPEALYDDVLDSMGPRETNKSQRIRELIALGQATETAAAAVGWEIPDDRRQQRDMIRQAFKDADRYAEEL